MLMNSIMKSYRDLVGQTDSVRPIIVAPGIREAANTSGYGPSEIQARRQRRQRRSDRVAQHGNFGWSVRTW